jgi:hypothetical protein
LDQIWTNQGIDFFLIPYSSNSSSSLLVTIFV